MILSCQNISKAFVENQVLKNVSFHIEDHEKAAIVGINGAGKTTLLRIIVGEMTPDDGQVVLARDKTLGYLAQNSTVDTSHTIYEELLSVKADLLRLEEKIRECENNMKHAEGDALEDLMKQYTSLTHAFETGGGYLYRSELVGVLKGLGFTEDEFSKPVATLSGGQKTRVALGRLLLQNPDLIILDEPTNHLDMNSIAWLETYLLNYKGAVLIVSHDRYFLDRVVQRSIDFTSGQAEFYSGNYSFYAVEKERRYLEKMRQYEKEQAKIAQLEKSAEQLRMFAFKGMDKTYRRALSMEKRIERMRTTDKPTKERALSAQFKSQEFYGDEVFALKKLKKSFGDRVLFHDVDLQVRGGERIALIGDNGTGKSTLIKMLMEEEYPDEGKIKFGPSVRIAYLPQIVEFDVPERNLVDTMLYSKRNITPQSARNRLAAFHFTGEDVFKSVSVLSGGELSRLKLCILMDDEVNLLILDEPTNHLDIASREWIEEAVESYDGTLLFVSHDRYFINRFATRVWELENGVITDYPMGFARYRQVKALEAQNKIDHTPKAVKEKTVTEKPKPNRSAQQARRQLTICEKEISAQETAIAEIEQRLEEAGGDYERYSEIYKEKEAAEQKLSELMEKWETLAEQAGE